MRNKMILICAVLSGVVWLAAACVNDNNGPNVKTYDRDGYMGLTESNPNLPAQPGYHTYNKDIDMMTDALRNIKGIQSSSVVINGAIAYVGLELPDDMPRSEVQRIEAEAYAQLTRMMPRYTIRVTSDEDEMQQMMRNTGK